MCSSLRKVEILPIVEGMKGNIFSEELKHIRAQLGLKSARSFFEWLKAKGVSFNYSYYMRLEQGGLPSEKVVNELASAIKGEAAEHLILKYCTLLFPKHERLFSINEKKAQPSTGAFEKQSNELKKAMPAQKELSMRQVMAIASSKSTYHLFLLLTLSRRPILEAELFSLSKSFQAALRTLASVDLLNVSDDGVEAKSIESRFPDSYNQELKDAYTKFDEWDEDFGIAFGFDLLLNKMLIRRVSGRYLSIIQTQLESLFELIRASDELDYKYNDQVLQLSVTMRKGKLPG